MISWAVSTAGVLTGQTSRTGSYSNSSDFGNSDSPDTSSYTLFDTVEARGSSTAYTSLGTSGSTTGYTTIYNFTISTSYSISQLLLDSDNNPTSTYTESSSYSLTNSDPSSSSSQTFLLNTIPSQTSTTSTASRSYKETTLTTQTTTAWTFSPENESNSVQFFTTTSSAASVATTRSSSFELTESTTTTTAGSMVESATAMVAQGGARADNAEVIYAITNPTSQWAGFAAAAAAAASATNTTLSSSLSTVSANIYAFTIPFVDPLTAELPPNATSSVSWSNAQTTYSFTYATTQTTQRTITAVNTSFLPNSTSEQTASTIATVSSSSQLTLWASTSGSSEFYATVYGGAVEAEAVTTTQATEYSTSYGQPQTVWRGSLSWNILNPVTATRTFVTTIPAAKNVVYAGSTRDYATALGQTMAKNIAAIIPTPIGTSQQGETFQNKFVPRYARLGASRGAWYELSDDEESFAFSNYAKDGRDNQTTLMLGTGSVYTLTKDSEGKYVVTFTKTQNSNSSNSATTATASASIAASGESTTTHISPVLGLFGGSPASEETFQRGISVGGAFRNLIDGSTYSFSPGATTYTSSVPVSHLQPVTALVPRNGTGTTAAFPIWWTAHRNSTALPPNMPPNA